MDLLVTKCPKRDCTIVNKFFRHFITNCYIIFLSNGETYDWDCLVYQTYFILVEKIIIS
jgi:hypothetical protein